jgi:hypothetical protein
MNPLKKLLTIAMSLAFAGAAVLPVCAQTTYINENYDGLTPPAAPVVGLPTAAVKQISSAVPNGVIGGGSGAVAWFNKTLSGTGNSGYLEYNAGPSALGSMYISFDLYNNAPSVATANQMTFGVGAWNATTGSGALNSSASRTFAMDFYQGTIKNSMTLRGTNNQSFASNVAYAANNLEQVQIWVNDNDATSIQYLRPDNSAIATLGANSVVFWINGQLVGTEADSGYVYNSGANGNATLGRLGFTATTANLGNFLIDNLNVASWSVVPEPGTFALTACGLAGLLVLRRRSAS